MIDRSSVRSITPKTKGNRGIFPSKKVPSGFVEYKSQIERDLYIVLEHADEVKRYQHQPKTIVYIDSNKKQRTYTPDTYIEFENGL
ncbi:MAG: hypothetical protein OEY49_12480 [Candidatus Heimdallarchaeota archaeon]|nr:hypothetical protein [Candidatus Heimdallarchaeota archaeon]